MTDHKVDLPTSHRFLDEAGDTTIYTKGKVPIIGTKGVSNAFSIGMVKVNEDVATLRKELLILAASVTRDVYVNALPSVRKRIAEGGFYFHATDDTPEIRERMFKFIVARDLSIEVVVARKDAGRFSKKHNNSESEFYADILGHLLKNKLELGCHLVLTIAKRGNTTKNNNLLKALEKAEYHLYRRKADAEITSRPVFNVADPRQEPMLWIPDYLCWVVQRVLEKGETRHYDFVREKVALVVDLYDTTNYTGGGNYYTRERPLTAKNKLGLPSP